MLQQIHAAQNGFDGSPYSRALANQADAVNTKNSHQAIFAEKAALVVSPQIIFG
jgi:hypothetical protein